MRSPTRPRLDSSVSHQKSLVATLPSLPSPSASASGVGGPVSLAGFLSRLVSLPAPAPAETLPKGNRSVTQNLRPAATSLEPRLKRRRSSKKEKEEASERGIREREARKKQGNERGSNAETRKRARQAPDSVPRPASFPPPHAFSGSSPLHHPTPSHPLAFPPRRLATPPAASPERCSCHRERPPRGGCRTVR